MHKDGLFEAIIWDGVENFIIIQIGEFLRTGMVMQDAYETPEITTFDTYRNRARHYKDL